MTDAAKSRTLKCPLCGHPELKTRIVSERYDLDTAYGTITVETSGVPIAYCENCGEDYSGPEAARIRDRALCQALGFRLPEEIQRIREDLGQTQESFALMLDVDQDTLSQWEKGRLIQDRRSERLLRLLANVPQAGRFLAQDCGIGGSVAAAEAEVPKPESEETPTQAVPVRQRRILVEE